MKGRDADCAADVSNDIYDVDDYNQDTPDTSSVKSSQERNEPLPE